MSSIECKQCGYDNPSGAKFCGNCGFSLSGQDEPSWQSQETAGFEQAKPPATYENMGFWVRFAAYIIDDIVISVVTFALSFSAIGVFVSILINFLYYWLFTGLKGQTLGKMALGIKVVDENGNIPGLGKAAMREIVGKFVCILTLGIGYLMIAWDKKKQGLHDKIAETYVIRA